MADLPRSPRVFLDACVLFAAAVSTTGASRAVIVLAEIGLIRPVVCPQVFEEVERHLQAKAPEALSFFHRVRDAIAWEVVSDATPEQVAACTDVIVAKDAPILAAAMAAKPECLVTLDTRDFGPPGVAQFSQLTIQTPAEFINNVRRVLAAGFTDR